VDHPLPEIPVVTRDKYKHYAVYKTRHNGALALFQSYGPVLIGACGVYHTYTILKENDSTANAFLIQIGIDPSKVDSCK
jgi:hypothetical protein